MTTYLILSRGMAYGNQGEGLKHCQCRGKCYELHGAEYHSPAFCLATKTVIEVVMK